MVTSAPLPPKKRVNVSKIPVKIVVSNCVIILSTFGGVPVADVKKYPRISDFNFFLSKVNLLHLMMIVRTLVES